MLFHLYNNVCFKIDVFSDYSQGFGGKYGVQKDRVDKSALGFDDKVDVPLHPSQTDMKKGFGGKFGVQKDRQDASAGSFEDIEPASSSYKPTRADPARKFHSLFLHIQIPPMGYISIV